MICSVTTLRKDAKADKWESSFLGAYFLLLLVWTWTLCYLAGRIWWPAFCPVCEELACTLLPELLSSCISNLTHSTSTTRPWVWHCLRELKGARRRLVPQKLSSYGGGNLRKNRLTTQPEKDMVSMGCAKFWEAQRKNCWDRSHVGGIEFSFTDKR